jgi:hypothetical protein
VQGAACQGEDGPAGGATAAVGTRRGRWRRIARKNERFRKMGTDHDAFDIWRPFGGGEVYGLYLVVLGLLKIERGEEEKRRLKRKKSESGP